MGSYLLAHDLGTSGNKATLYSVEGELIGNVVSSYETSYPKERYVEQNPEDWWKAVCSSTRELLAQTEINPREILSVSFSAQMMGCLLVDRDLRPLRPMIIWADTRSDREEAEMIKAVGMERGYRITGHRLSASYSAAKLLWVKRHEPDIYRRADKMIHAKDYIIGKLTGEIVTDLSDASGTNLLDIDKKEWSEELVGAFGIRRELLPELHASTDLAGTVNREAAQLTGLCEGTPVVLGGGDGSCSCVGAGVYEEGKAYCVLGTSSWISLASQEPYFDPEMKSFNWVHLDPKLYTPCGTMQAAGYSYQWYRDLFCKEEKERALCEGKMIYAYLDDGVLRSPPGANRLIYLPYPLGERSPHWDHNARAVFLGMGASTTKEDLTRAVLEGVGFNLKIILDIIEKKRKIPELILIGGGAKGAVWQQILSDIWEKELLIPENLEEATSMGAAVCGGVGVKAFSDFSVVSRFNRMARRVKPQSVNAPIYRELYPIFQEAYQNLKPVYQRLANLGMKERDDEIH